MVLIYLYKKYNISLLNIKSDKHLKNTFNLHKKRYRLIPCFSENYELNLLKDSRVFSLFFIKTFVKYFSLFVSNFKVKHGIFNYMLSKLFIKNNLLFVILFSKKTLFGESYSFLYKLFNQKRLSFFNIKDFSFFYKSFLFFCLLKYLFYFFLFNKHLFGKFLELNMNYSKQHNLFFFLNSLNSCSSDKKSFISFFKLYFFFIFNLKKHLIFDFNFKNVNKKFDYYFSENLNTFSSKFNLNSDFILFSRNMLLRSFFLEQENLSLFLNYNYICNSGKSYNMFLNHFVGLITKRGLKAKAFNTVLTLFLLYQDRNLKTKNNLFLSNSLSIIQPMFRVLKFKLRGRSKLIPQGLISSKIYSFAFNSIVKPASKRSDNKFVLKLLSELLDIYSYKGVVLKDKVLALKTFIQNQKSINTSIYATRKKKNLRGNFLI